MALLDLLTQRGTLQVGTVSRSDTGQELITWTTEEDGIPCLVRLQPFLVELKPGTAKTATHTIVLPFRQVLIEPPKLNRRLLLGGEEYRFEEVRNPANRKHHLEVHSRRVE